MRLTLHMCAYVNVRACMNMNMCVQACVPTYIWVHFACICALVFEVCTCLVCVYYDHYMCGFHVCTFTCMSFHVFNLHVCIHGSVRIAHIPPLMQWISSSTPQLPWPWTKC